LELATSSSVRQSGSLTLAAIAAVFTINHVAEMLGEDEDWMYELSIDSKRCGYSLAIFRLTGDTLYLI